MIGDEPDRRGAGGQGLLMAAAAEEEAGTLDVVAGRLGAVLGLNPDRLVQVGERGRAPVGRQVLATGEQERPAMVERGPGRGILRPLDGTSERERRRVEPAHDAGQGILDPRLKEAKPRPATLAATGLRRAHFAARSMSGAGRALIGSPRRNRSRSSASAWADA